MKMVQRMFQIRTCRIEIDGTLPRPCLYYDMHACLGPCVAGLTTRSAYDEAVKDVLLFLSGRSEELKPRLELKMRAAAESENFEMAAAYLFYLCRNHPFVDGNKRTGIAATALFLRANGWHLTAGQVELPQFPELILGKRLT